jgi:hypothetical protein
MNLFMDPSLFASLSYHKIFFKPRQGGLLLLRYSVGGKAYNPVLGFKRRKEAKEARDEAREEACNRL